MGVSSITNIASGEVFVKSTFPGDRKKTQSHSGLNPSCRPDVLSKMPRSCNLVFDVLRSMIDQKGQAAVSIRYLAQVTGLGTTAVWRALRRLRGAHLISLAADSDGNRARVWQLRWRSPLASFPQISVPLASIRYKTREKEFSPNGTSRPADSNQPSKRALAWAITQVRNELARNYANEAARNRAITSGIAVGLWRAMCRGKVHAGPDLADFVWDLLRRLRDARGVGDETRAWCSWAGWAVQSVVNERTAHARELATTERLVEEIRREKERSRRGFNEFLEALGVSSLREYVASVSAVGG